MVGYGGDDMNIVHVTPTDWLGTSPSTTTITMTVSARSARPTRSAAASTLPPVGAGHDGGAMRGLLVPDGLAAVENYASAFPSGLRRVIIVRHEPSTPITKVTSMTDGELHMRHDLSVNRAEHYAWCRARLEAGLARSLATAPDPAALKVTLERNIEFCSQVEREEAEALVKIEEELELRHPRPLLLLPPARP